MVQDNIEYRPDEITMLGIILIRLRVRTIRHLVYCYIGQVGHRRGMGVGRGERNVYKKYVIW